MKLKTETKVTLTMTAEQARILSFILEFGTVTAYEKEEEKHIEKATKFAEELAALIDTKVN